MRRGSVSPRCLLLPCLAFVAGAGVGVSERPGSPEWACAATLIVGGVLSTPRARSRAAVLAAGLSACAAFAGGWARGRHDLADHLVRVDGFFGDRAVVERAIAATVLGAAVRAPDGTRTLTVLEEDSGIRACLRVRAPDSAPVDVVDALLRGDRVQVAIRAVRTPFETRAGRTDPRAAMRARGDDLSATVKNVRLVEFLLAGPELPYRWIDRARAGARDRLDRALAHDPTARSIVAAMTLGDTAALDGSTRGAFRDAGLAHLLAISGLHVQLALAAVLAVVARGRRTLRLAVGTACAAAVVPLVGAGAPVIRAAACAVWRLSSERLGRRHDPLHALVVVAAALAFVRPAIVLGVGFQLSFAATAGLILLAGPAAASVRAMGASLAAYLATAPLAAWHFGLLTPAALLTGVASAAGCAAVLATGTLAILCEPFDSCGTLAATLAAASAGAVLRLSEWAGALPESTCSVPRPGVWVCPIYIAALLAARNQPGGSRARPALAGAAGVALAVLHLGPPPNVPQFALAVHVLDVGQGQAVVLRGERGRCALIDAGPAREGFDVGARVVVPYLLGAGCRSLAVLAISHSHDDHAGGAGAVVGALDVGELWIAPGDVRVDTVRAVVDEARRRGTAIVLAEAGGRRALDGLDIVIEHPTRDDLDLGTNDRSLVLRASGVCGSVLIPGDAGLTAESRILERAPNLSADLLVLGHHGAKDASGDAWLAAVAPAFAVASAGRRNPFGHPDPRVLERLHERGVRTARTDAHGDVAWRCGSGEDGSFRTGSAGEP